MYNSNYGYERRSRGSWIWPTLIAINLGNLVFQGGMALGRHEEHASDRIQNVQAYNAQVHEQLADNYDELDGLTLTNGDNQTFTFHTKKQAGQDETCHGNYKVHGDKAHAVGKIICATTTTVK